MDDRYQEFAENVTLLSERLGIGIEGGVLYERIPEDRFFRYMCNGEGVLVRV